MPGNSFDKNRTVAILGDLFRSHGYHGTTLSIIKEASGLGKGSFYHHFPEGKEGAAGRVLDEVHEWFENHVYAPLEKPPFNRHSIENMTAKTLEFFQNGNRVCVPGSFALYDARDLFPDQIRTYFERWIAALAFNLKKQGVAASESRALAAQAVAEIQGGLVVSRALQDPDLFAKILKRTERDLLRIIQS